MSKETDQPIPQGEAKGDDFEKRHGQELGVKKFAVVQTTYTLIPILTAAAGAVLGYFVLAKPVAKMMPSWSKAAAIIEGSAGRIKDSFMEIVRGKNAAQAFYDIAPNEEVLEKLKTVWGEGSTLKKAAKFEETAKLLNIKLPDPPKTFRWGSMFGGLFLGSTAGGIAVGYDKWRKDESARLAAQEINKDIANLELFKPSDPELLAENKRLSSMVAALPTIDVATAEKQGRVEEKQQAASK